MSGCEAESSPGGPLRATANAGEGGPARELDTLPEPSELSEVFEAEIVEAGTAGPEPDPTANPHVADGYTPDGFPTLDYVRQRIAASLGAEEAFARPDPAADEAAQQEALRQAAAARLAGLRDDLARDEQAP
ncbi:hypothetical protein [Segniliparus rugosus]|uniref:Uncharacterized protein n=1 Tax=Segniliparus rugosus (strain ATCC BAA-974 / DSM 45345 / CCUG 50838 / CIP 108380 / JCM 13579 / CDC 945) TaxID=679197 RepID=E5XUM0_SEGRC|nr:hypothetical protein [Segniliparus rugosus]EFV11944.2 hypothetical protein HMPREF9336_03192 [Segniliparus rugosus ATCC BAA-974]